MSEDRGAQIRPERVFLHHSRNDGFYKKAIYIERQCRCDYLRLRERGKHDNSCFRFGVRFSCTDQLGEFQAIHSRHIDVSDDQIKCVGYKQIDGEFRIVHVDDICVSDIAQNPENDLAREMVILNNKDFELVSFLNCFWNRASSWQIRVIVHNKITERLLIHRLGNEVALRRIASNDLQRIPILLRFYTFCHTLDQ